MFKWFFIQLLSSFRNYLLYNSCLLLFFIQSLFFIGKIYFILCWWIVYKENKFYILIIKVRVVFHLFRLVFFLWHFMENFYFLSWKSSRNFPNYDGLLQLQYFHVNSWVFFPTESSVYHCKINHPISTEHNQEKFYYLSQKNEKPKKSNQH